MISVIIPTYNREKTIVNSVKSVLNQTYKDIEIIIVDDNSTDNTFEVIRELNDNRIKYIKLEKNYGACGARNIGIERSIGELIAFQDSDDIWHEDKLEKQIKFLTNTNSDVVACAFNFFSNNRVQIKPSRQIDNVEYDDIIRENFISTQTILGKRRCFIEDNFDVNMPRFQDWELVIRLCKKWNINFQAEPLVDVYLQDDSISKNNLNAIEALKLIIEKNNKFFEKNKKMLSYYYRRMAEFAIKDNLDFKKFYIEAIKIDPLNIKNIGKFIKVVLLKRE